MLTRQVLCENSAPQEREALDAAPELPARLNAMLDTLTEELGPALPLLQARPAARGAGWCLLLRRLVAPARIGAVARLA